MNDVRDLTGESFELATILTSARYEAHYPSDDAASGCVELDTPSTVARISRMRSFRSARN